MFKSLISKNSYLNNNYKINIFLKISMNFSSGRGSQLTKNYEKELGEYKKLKKNYIKRHQKEFWEEQTKVENNTIEEFYSIQKEKKKNDDAKLRTSIIINSHRCYENMVR
jgi:hypothetical protein